MVEEPANSLCMPSRFATGTARVCRACRPQTTAYTHAWVAFCVGGSTGGAAIVLLPTTRALLPRRLLARARALVPGLFFFLALALALPLAFCVGVTHIVVRSRFLPGFLVF